MSKEHYTKNELKSYAKGCYELGEEFYKNLKKNKEKTLVIVGVRGGYPVWQGMLNYISKRVLDEKRDDLLEKITVLYVPTSNKNKTREFTKQYFKELGKKDYKNLIIIDEARSGASVKGVFDQLIKPYFEDKNIEMYIASDKNTQEITTKQRKNVIDKLSEQIKIKTVDIPAFTMDNRKLLGVDYKVNNPKTITGSGKYSSKGTSFATIPLMFSHPTHPIGSINPIQKNAQKEKLEITKKFYKDLSKKIDELYTEENKSKKN
ncbi:MAG: hypothetical protein PHW96_02535 [Candidatus Nanoarchaeia archaeon]|nr:hypothetical protein [Candidatus Nanoarchaeia archaeon]